MISTLTNINNNHVFVGNTNLVITERENQILVCKHSFHTVLKSIIFHSFMRTKTT